MAGMQTVPAKGLGFSPEIEYHKGMAVYIAVCDDNIADRKQLERLLGRENQKRTGEGVTLYIDSFGSSEALCKTPSRYDLFLIDITGKKDESGLTVAKRLRDMGIEALIVLISSKVDYAQIAPEDSDYIFRTQPIYKKDISELVELAIEYSKAKTPQIGIRCKNETHFVDPSDFVYASAKNKASGMEVFLSDGSKIMSTQLISQFASDIAFFDDIMACDLYYVNLAYVSALTPTRILLKDGTKLPIPLKYFPAIKRSLRQRDKT